MLVRIYLDLGSLSRELRIAGSFCEHEILQQFLRGFPRYQPLFDLVDVGYGREQVESKLEGIIDIRNLPTLPGVRWLIMLLSSSDSELLELNIGIAQCQHIFLGCHDNSLASRLLQSHAANGLDESRITLIKPSESDFESNDASLAFPVVHFASVFRSVDSSSKLVETSTQPPQRSKHRSSGSSSTLTENLNRPPSPYSSRNSNKSGFHETPISIFRSKMSRQPLAPNQRPTLAWDPNQNIVLLNVNGERIDSYLGKTDPQAHERVQKRIQDEGKLCNDFHLRGKCFAGTACAYGHEPHLDVPELAVLRYLARKVICDNGSSCRIIDCWYGHMCSYGKSCPKQNCIFRHLHHMDRTAVSVWHKEDPI